MKKLVMLIVLALVGVVTWYFWETKPTPDDETPRLPAMPVSQHSDSLNLSVQKVLNDYYTLSEAFVSWDSTAIRNRASSMQKSMEQAYFEELKQDSLIYQTAESFLQNMQQSLSTISQTKDIKVQRHSYHTLSQNLYDFLRTIRYDASKVYLQECPMAFNDTEAAIWLSHEEAIRNPYLGLYHPKYGKGMLVCGETKDSLHAGR